MSSQIPQRPIALKHKNVVHPPIRRSARGQSCTLRLPCCNHDPATTVLAHLRFFGWAGISQKPSDLLAVYACSACHDAIDRRSDADCEMFGFDDLLRALGETLMEHEREGRLLFS